ncbi:MAG: bacteriophage holin [Candidatus Omnitrophica bacterium]|nr:bacteriophage holin [Candidatus Omnitrophota bacterium]MBU1997459.1 bacteriophage holin [Candidatus Omnitrophota bacterium]MBU4332991.1 bacteriophage holin [Candidatus Omnitrophota bacterium]
MAKLDLKTFGINFGFIWSLCIIALGILAAKYTWANKMVETISSVYKGFQTTLMGVIIGGIWGFIDGVIGGVIIAWLFNKFLG